VAEENNKAQWFDVLLTIRGKIGETLAQQVSNKLANEDDRKRKRKPQDQLIFEAQVMAVVANLAAQVIDADERPILIQRSNRVLGRTSRYKPFFETKSLKDTLDLFEAAGFIDQTKGSRIRNPFGGRDLVEATRITPTGDFVELVESAGIGPEDFEHRLDCGETIILKAKNDNDYWSKSKPVEFDDNELSIRYSNELSSINEFISKADITYAEDEFGRSGSVRIHDRKLRRVFTGGDEGFNKCGRLFGGFWLDLPREQRLSRLRINGQKVVSLDYGQMIVRLAYGHVEQPCDMEDAYDIAPYGIKYREGFKKLISSMLFSRKAIKRKPQGTKDMLPPDDVSVLCKSVAEVHAPISSLFYTGIGHNLMFKESEVILSVMHELIDNDIVALPIHDAIVVAKGDADVAHQVMNNMFLSEVGIRGIIKKEEQ